MVKIVKKTIVFHPYKFYSVPRFLTYEINLKQLKGCLGLVGFYIYTDIKFKLNNNFSKFKYPGVSRNLKNI